MCVCEILMFVCKREKERRRKENEMQTQDVEEVGFRSARPEAHTGIMFWGMLDEPTYDHDPHMWMRLRENTKMRLLYSRLRC